MILETETYAVSRKLRLECRDRNISHDAQAGRDERTLNRRERLAVTHRFCKFMSRGSEAQRDDGPIGFSARIGFYTQSRLAIVPLNETLVLQQTEMEFESRFLIRRALLLQFFNVSRRPWCVLKGNEQALDVVGIWPHGFILAGL
jgi:hypothetical protein